MKKLFACLTIFAIGTIVANAQTSTTTTTTPAPVVTTEKVEQTTPAVIAVEAQEGTVKCTSTGTKSCCSHNASRSSALTAPDASSTAATSTSETPAATSTTTVEVTNAPACHQVSVSVSAAKPEAAETEKKEDPKE